MVEFTLNNESSEKFVVNIGKYIINFGAIELTIIQMIECLARDLVLVKYAKRSMLSRRLEILKDLIEQSGYDDEFKNVILEHLKELQPFIQLRNIIAHNPIVYSFPDKNPNKPATGAGVWNLKPRNQSQRTELISAEEIEDGVNNTSVIAKWLRGDFDRIQSHEGNEGP